MPGKRRDQGDSGKEVPRLQRSSGWDNLAARVRSSPHLSLAPQRPRQGPYGDLAEERRHDKLNLSPLPAAPRQLLVEGLEERREVLRCEIVSVPALAKLGDAAKGRRAVTTDIDGRMWALHRSWPEETGQGHWSCESIYKSCRHRPLPHRAV